MAVENAKQVGWMLDGSACCSYKFLGDSRSHVAGLVNRKPIDDSKDFRTGVMADEVDPGSFLNSAATALLLLELEKRMDATENSYANTQNIYSFLFICAP